MSYRDDGSGRRYYSNQNRGYSSRPWGSSSPDYGSRRDDHYLDQWGRRERDRPVRSDRVDYRPPFRPRDDRAPRPRFSEGSYTDDPYAYSRDRYPLERSQRCEQPRFVVEEPSRSTQEVIAEVTRAKAMVEKAAEEPKVSDAAMLEEAIHILNEQRKFSPAVEQFSAPFVILTNSWD